VVRFFINARAGVADEGALLIMGLDVAGDEFDIFCTTALAIMV
jgi:hypothetical protein